LGRGRKKICRGDEEIIISDGVCLIFLKLRFCLRKKNSEFRIQESEARIRINQQQIFRRLFEG
jgi:hypothetical protein